MRKNVLIVLLVLATAGALVFAYQQKSRADFCDRIAKQKDGTIAALQASRERLQKTAEQGMNDAVVQSRRAEEALAKCRKK